MDKVTEKEINTALDNMKNGEEGLDRAYDDTIDRIENQGQNFRGWAKKILFWIVHATRPLSTEELRHALAVEPDTSNLDMTNLCPVKEIVSSCAGLVTIDQDSDIVQLVHYTTQEYFQRRRSQSLWQDVPRDIIAKSCLTYLSFDVFAEGYCRSETLETRLQQNPFLDYAAKNWAYHSRYTQRSVGDLALRFLMDDAKVSASSQVLFGWRATEQFCGMHLVAYFGLYRIMIRLLEKKDPDTKDSRGQTPLSYAAEKGNTSVVELLIDNNVDLSSKSKDGLTPLSRAVEGRRAGVVQLLLAQRVEMDYRYRDVSKSNRD
jgi:Ankyrin repeats (3 copies)